MERIPSARWWRERAPWAFLLPTPERDRLFDTIRAEGALPRKTFSLGSANEKRYYMECRRL